METIQNIWQLKGRPLHRQVRRAETTRRMLKNKAKLALDIGAAEGFVIILDLIKIKYKKRP